MKLVADALNVSERTIQRDLAGNSDTVSESKPNPKTATNPKGAGRLLIMMDARRGAKQLAASSI